MLVGLGRSPVSDGHTKSMRRMASDGFRLYFTEMVGGHSSLAAVPGRGGEIVPIPTPFKDVTLLRGSPNGSELLLAEGQFGEEGPLWVLPIAARSPRRFGDAVGHDGSWWPDGRTIVWENGPDLYVSNSDGTGSRKFLGTNAVGATRANGPTWSPDGKHLRFVLWTSYDFHAIWEVSPDATGLHPLLPGWDNPPSQGCPAWTPDGRHFLGLPVAAAKGSVHCTLRGRWQCRWRGSHRAAGHRATRARRGSSRHTASPACSTWPNAATLPAAGHR